MSDSLGIVEASYKLVPAAVVDSISFLFEHIT